MGDMGGIERRVKIRINKKMIPSRSVRQSPEIRLWKGVSYIEGIEVGAEKVQQEWETCITKEHGRSPNTN